MSKETIDVMTKASEGNMEGVDEPEVAGTIIYIDPEKEAAVLRKFDKFLLPVSVVFLVLSTLDRNNVSLATLYQL